MRVYVLHVERVCVCVCVCKGGVRWGELRVCVRPH